MLHLLYVRSLIKGFLRVPQTENGVSRVKLHTRTNKRMTSPTASPRQGLADNGRSVEGRRRPSTWSLQAQQRGCVARNPGGREHKSRCPKTGSIAAVLGVWPVWPGARARESELATTQ